MKYRSIFHLISSLAQKSNIHIVLIGGFAVNYYKVTRQTVDVDFLITKDEFEKIASLLEKEGYKKAYDGGTFIQLVNDASYLMDLDFMFIDKDVMDSITAEGEKIRIAGSEFIVPSVKHLVALKLHSIKNNPKGRKLKDLPDIVSLIRINKINTKTEEFKKICLKYGTEGLYKTILEHT
ncbi:MAG: nucleotidyltransferase [Candidatus Omnitrophica bacterium]|nr:nucleotidyltransferase [Candidatus Omnitrophota bacterium]